MAVHISKHELEIYKLLWKTYLIKILHADKSFGPDKLIMALGFESQILKNWLSTFFAEIFVLTYIDFDVLFFSELDKVSNDAGFAQKQKYC